MNFSFKNLLKKKTNSDPTYSRQQLQGEPGNRASLCVVTSADPWLFELPDISNQSCGDTEEEGGVLAGDSPRRPASSLACVDQKMAAK